MGSQEIPPKVVEGLKAAHAAPQEPEKETKMHGAGRKLGIIGKAGWVGGLAVGLLLLAPVSQAAPGAKGGHDRFAALDTNGDGVITREEADAGSAARRQAIDANGDGEISFEEMAAQVRSRREERARERFAELDANGDGRVTVDELPDRGARMFDLLDADDDGRVTREEIEQAREHRRHRGERGRHRPRGD